MREGQSCVKMEIKKIIVEFTKDKLYLKTLHGAGFNLSVLSIHSSQHSSTKAVPDTNLSKNQRYYKIPFRNFIIFLLIS